MGNGSVSNSRWQPDRVLTPKEQVTYWQNRAMQLTAENRHLSKAVLRFDRVNERLALEISAANKTIIAQKLIIEEYQRTFGPILLPEN